MAKIINGCFLSVIFFFSILFFIGGGADDMFEIEKRELRELPTLEEYTLNELPEKYTEYISDHFPLRRVIMKAASTGSYNIFGSIRSDAVVIGKKRFLFLNTMDNTSPKKDYQGTNLFSDSEIARLKETAASLQAAAQTRGQKVLLMIVPNKEEVYSQYLPESYNRLNEITRRQQFCRRMQDAGIDVLDITEDLKSYTQTENDIYFLADTHWTGKGAYIGMAAILDYMDIDHIPYRENSFSSGNYYESDIANLCNLYDEYTDTHDFNAEKDICTEKSEMTVSFIGDSFRWRITEYLNESFRQVNIFDHEFSQEELKKTQSDFLVIQVVERNLGNMQYLIPKATY